MDKVRIIAIMGYKRSGKDTLADYLESNFNFTKMSIAEPLKESCKLLFGLTENEVNTDEKDKPLHNWNNLSSRQILQFFGTEMMQFKLAELMPSIGRNFWMKSLINRIENSNKKNIVIPDVRFYHEYQSLIDHFEKPNVTFIKVFRDVVNKTHQDNHVSEQEWLDLYSNIVLHNNGTVEDLYKEAMVKLRKSDSSGTFN
jgi:hypothetical protein